MQMPQHSYIFAICAEKLASRLRMNGQLNIGMQEWVSTAKFIILNSHIDTVWRTRMRFFMLVVQQFSRKSHIVVMLWHHRLGSFSFALRCFGYNVVIQTNPIKLQCWACACAHVCSNKLLSIQPSPSAAKETKNSMCDEMPVLRTQNKWFFFLQMNEPRHVEVEWQHPKLDFVDRDVLKPRLIFRRTHTHTRIVWWFMWQCGYCSWSHVSLPIRIQISVIFDE